MAGRRAQLERGGTLPPRTYFRFDAESVRIEREQLINLGLEFVPA